VLRGVACEKYHEMQSAVNVEGCRVCEVCEGMQRVGSVEACGVRKV